MYLVCLSERTRSLHWNDVQTHSKGAPFLPCLHPKHTTSSLLPPPSLPLYWFTSSFPASVTFYGDDVHTFSPFAQSHPAWKITEAQQVVRYPTKHSFPLRILLPFRFGHLIVFYCRGNFFFLLVHYKMASIRKFSPQKLLFTHSPGNIQEISNKSIMSWFSCRVSRELILTLKQVKAQIYLLVSSAALDSFTSSGTS